MYAYKEVHKITKEEFKILKSAGFAIDNGIKEAFPQFIKNEIIPKSWEDDPDAIDEYLEEIYNSPIGWALQENINEEIYWGLLPDYIQKVFLSNELNCISYIEEVLGCMWETVMNDFLSEEDDLDVIWHKLNTYMNEYFEINEAEEELSLKKFIEENYPEIL